MKFMRHWHARLGVFTAVFFLLLALSGVALNHTDALGLAKRDIHAAWLMRWYGLKPLLPASAYLFKEGYVVESGKRWIMDGKVLAGHGTNQVLVGAASWGNMRAVASTNDLYLYMRDGQLIDHLSGASLPSAKINQLGVLGADANSQLVLQTAQGNFVTMDGLAWQRLSAEKLKATELPIWAREQALPASLKEKLNGVLAPSLPLERIVLDTHSGRIFGRYGVLVMDAVAIGLIVLSLSGVWIYLRSRRRQSHH